VNQGGTVCSGGLELKEEIDRLTLGGRLIEAVVATHPFHTLGFAPFFEVYGAMETVKSVVAGSPETPIGGGGCGCGCGGSDGDEGKYQGGSHSTAAAAAVAEAAAAAAAVDPVVAAVQERAAKLGIHPPPLAGEADGGSSGGGAGSSSSNHNNNNKIQWFGTPRHLRRLSAEIPWQRATVCSASVQNHWADRGVQLRLPPNDCAEFNDPQPAASNHFNNVFVFHRRSKCVHNDDCLCYFDSPLTRMGKVTLVLPDVSHDNLAFHASMHVSGLRKTPEAPPLFANWVEGLCSDWDFECMASAHNGVLKGGANARVRKLLTHTRPKLHALAEENSKAQGLLASSSPSSKSVSSAPILAATESKGSCAFIHMHFPSHFQPPGPQFESDPRLDEGSGRRAKPAQNSKRIKYPRLEDDVVDKVSE
jgi:hypothetical protein